MAEDEFYRLSYSQYRKAFFILLIFITAMIYISLYMFLFVDRLVSMTILNLSFLFFIFFLFVLSLMLRDEDRKRIVERSKIYLLLKDYLDEDEIVSEQEQIQIKKKKKKEEKEAEETEELKEEEEKKKESFWSFKSPR
jgi:cbb3-type cytochrome oxidase subunit 3